VRRICCRKRLEKSGRLEFHYAKWEDKGKDTGSRKMGGRREEMPESLYII